MDKRIEKIKKIRQFLLEQLKELTPEQLNTIPAGFNNNIVWNLAHMTCAQQTICYLRSGQKPVVGEKFIAPFLTNTKPGGWITLGEIEEIKNLFLSTIDWMQHDYVTERFSNYTASPNILRVYSIELKSIEDAFDFLGYHDGVHSGAIIALKKFIIVKD